MTNLGKKIRRPTNFGNNGTVSFATNGSTDDISQNSFEDATEEIEETKEETVETPQVPEVKVNFFMKLRFSEKWRGHMNLSKSPSLFDIALQ